MIISVKFVSLTRILGPISKKKIKKIKKRYIYI